MVCLKNICINTLHKGDNDDDDDDDNDNDNDDNDNDNNNNNNNNLLFSYVVWAIHILSVSESLPGCSGYRVVLFFVRYAIMPKKELNMTVFCVTYESLWRNSWPSSV